MPRPNPLSGLYLGLQSFLGRTGLQALSPARDTTFLFHLAAACRALEKDTLRYFFPYTTTNLYRWPQFSPQATWTLWTEEDLLAVTSVQVAVSGTNAVPVPLTHYFLEPQWAGPPYSRIEIDLSSQDAYQSGPTPQRSISVTGQWGYSSATVAAGNLLSGLASDPTATSMTVDTPGLIDTRDLLLLDTEQVTVVLGGAATVTIQRGVNGTTAATHTNVTPISKYVAPADVVEVVVGDALSAFQRDQSIWGKASQGSAQVPSFETVVQTGRATRRQQVIDHYARARSYAI